MTIIVAKKITSLCVDQPECVVNMFCVEYNVKNVSHGQHSKLLMVAMWILAWKNNNNRKIKILD